MATLWRQYQRIIQLEYFPFIHLTDNQYKLQYHNIIVCPSYPIAWYLKVVQICKHVIARAAFGSGFNWTGKRDNSGHIPTTVNKTGIVLSLDQFPDSNSELWNMWSVAWCSGCRYFENFTSPTKVTYLQVFMQVLYGTGSVIPLKLKATWTIKWKLAVSTIYFIPHPLQTGVPMSCQLYFVC